MNDAIEQLAECARRTQLARMMYRKPAEKEPSWRRVEPYKIVEGPEELSVRCFQLYRGPAREEGWKHFRVDRIVEIEVDTEPFSPRTIITITDGQLHPMKPRGPQPTRRQVYFTHLSEALADGRITDDERQRAEAIVLGLQPSDVRFVHARVFSDVLNELLIDGDLDHQEERYLAQVRNFLDALGWSP